VVVPWRLGLGGGEVVRTSRRKGVVFVVVGEGEARRDIIIAATIPAMRAAAVVAIVIAMRHGEGIHRMKTNRKIIEILYECNISIYHSIREQ
jgi:hypothetical protein